MSDEKIREGLGAGENLIALAYLTSEMISR